jgi:hypothetical protein
MSDCKHTHGRTIGWLGDTMSSKQVFVRVELVAVKVFFVFSFADAKKFFLTLRASVENRLD